MSSDASIEVFISRLPHAMDLALPAYETEGAAGMDLRAAIPLDEKRILSPGRRLLIPTGFMLSFSKMYVAEIRPRSGLALQYGITCLNTPGTIDSDYRGEIKVLLIHLGDEDFIITRGMRIAQIIFSPVARVTLQETRFLENTARNDGGFGSTGI